MKKSKIALGMLGGGLLLIVIVLLSSIFLSSETNITGKSIEEERKEVLESLDKGIQKFKEEGKYDCCLEPACQMCYLGDWVWENGECHCDKEMKEGNWDRVCPECEKGMEEGRCKNSEGEACSLNHEN